MWGQYDLYIFVSIRKIVSYIFTDIDTLFEYLDKLLCLYVNIDLYRQKER